MPNVSDQIPTTSPILRQRIPTTQLRPGMFLVRVLDSWWKSPFFFHRRLLKSSAEVEQLQRSGIREVEIDTSKGIAASPDSEEVVFEESALADTSGSMESCDQTGTDSPDTHTSSFQTKTEGDGDLESPESKARQELVQLREDAMAAVEGAFDGVKTGQPIPQPAIYTLSQKLVQKALLHPVLLAETLLIDSLKQFDKTLYAHVVDTAVYVILVGLQLRWDEGKLEQIGVAGLLHDVGYMRLPQNIVKAQWERGRHSALLKEHVTIGEALVKRQAQFSPDIVRMIGEHHACQDGSGYPKRHGGDSLLESSQLLGIMDNFDELLTIGGTSGALPAALAIRKLYKEAQTGKFQTLYIEALIRTLGVFPLGTVVQLSTNESAVVMKPNPDMSVKPVVKIFQGTNGEMLEEPKICDLASQSNQKDDVRIVKVLESTEYSIDLQEYF
jgi:HD-GYP domain-containing protein (c-di-GMP phosphodiesterase class II)